MQIERVRRVANGARRRRSTRKSSVVNPAHMLTLGFVNPKRRNMPARTHKKRRRATSNARRRSTRKTTSNHRRRRTRNPSQRVVVMGPRANRRRRNTHRPRRKGTRNPQFFGAHVTPMKMTEYIAGGLIGLVINKALLPMLPASITGNNLFAVGAAIVLAVAEWWAFSFVGKDFGSAVGFGALMNAGAQAVTTFIPSVGSSVGLSGRRGFGDLVSSQPGLPFWPSSMLMAGQANYTGMSAAYPVAYGR